MTMGKRFFVLTLLAGLFAAAVPAQAGHLGSPVEQARIAGTAAVVPSAPADVTDRILVRYRQGATASARGKARRSARVEHIRTLRAEGWEVVDPAVGETIDGALARLRSEGVVAEAVPDVLIQHADTIPNDKHFDKQWALHNTGQKYWGTLRGTAGADVDAPASWDTTTGSSSVTVAVVDTGVAYDHADLAPNVVILPGSDWVDDDGDPYDEEEHGTHVAGIVGARGNDGYGVAGVAWNVKLMPLRVLGSSGGTIIDIVDAMDFAARNGAKVVNLSLGAETSSEWVKETFEQVIKAWPSVLFVAAAGNASKNVETKPFYPCNVTRVNLICVAATTPSDSLASFSNYGTTSVDLGAPGSDILSTTKPGYLAYMSGTSMAAPMVSGAAALLWSHRPSLTVAEVRAALLSTGDPKSSLSEKTVTGRRLNVASALASLALFSDVAASSPYRPFIETIYEASITGGCGTDPLRYCPGTNVTRGQMAVFLVKAMGLEEALPASASGLFADVSSSRADARYIERLYLEGITGGCSSAPLSYCPGLKVTRGQMAVFLIKAMGHDDHLPSFQGLFSDVPVTHGMAPYIEHLKEHEITSGCTATRYCPGSAVTRAQMAVFLARAFDLL